MSINEFPASLQRDLDTLHAELGDRAYAEVMAEVDITYDDNCEMADLIFSRLLDAKCEMARS